MADPLSITLAAVTLVTALRDIVELGDKIRDSFAKVPDNLRKSRKLALEISETLHKVKNFYEENHDILEKKPELKQALVNLKRKLKEVHRHCAHLAPLSSERYIGHLKIAIYICRHGGRIEAELSELQKAVHDYFLEFTMFGCMRTEVSLSKLQQSQSHQTQTILTAVLDLRVSDGHIHTFHTPRITISRPLSDMDENIAAEMHLKVQVHKVGKMLNNFSIDFTISNLNQQKILSISPDPFFYVMDTFSRTNRSSLYQGAVQHSFMMQDLLQGSPISSIWKQGIKYLDNLGFQLNSLGMFEEAAHTQSWLVRLHRILVSQDPQNRTPYLINVLWNLSIYYRWSNNIGAAYNAIEECIALSQQLQNPSASTQTRLMHADALMELHCVVNLMGNSAQSSIIIQQAIKGYENAFDINSGLDGRPSNLSPTWWSHNTLHADIFQYTQALHYLAKHLQQQGSIQDSFNAEMKALSILHNIVILNPDTSADHLVAGILYNLSSQEFREMMSMDQSLLYLEQCIVIEQKYAELNPTQFGKDLCISLWWKTIILLKMGKEEAGLASITHAAELAPRLVNDEGFITRIKEKKKWCLEEMSHHSI